MPTQMFCKYFLVSRAANPCPALGGGDDFKISCLGEFLHNLGERGFLDLGMPYGT